MTVAAAESCLRYPLTPMQVYTARGAATIETTTTVSLGIREPIKKQYAPIIICSCIVVMTLRSNISMRNDKRREAFLVHVGFITHTSYIHVDVSLLLPPTCIAVQYVGTSVVPAVNYII